jgi:hypothetical protein
MDLLPSSGTNMKNSVKVPGYRKMFWSWRKIELEKEMNTAINGLNIASYPYKSSSIHHLKQRYSTCFVRVTPDVISLQL